MEENVKTKKVIIRRNQSNRIKNRLKVTLKVIKNVFHILKIVKLNAAIEFHL